MYSCNVFRPHIYFVSNDIASRRYPGESGVQRLVLPIMILP